VGLIYSGEINRREREKTERPPEDFRFFSFDFFFLSFLPSLSQEEEEGALARICVLIYYYSLVISLRRDL
jgi:hypothetical protein